MFSILHQSATVSLSHTLLWLLALRDHLLTCCFQSSSGKYTTSVDSEPAPTGKGLSQAWCCRWGFYAWILLGVHRPLSSFNPNELSQHWFSLIWEENLALTLVWSQAPDCIYLALTCQSPSWTQSPAPSACTGAWNWAPKCTILSVCMASGIILCFPRNSLFPAFGALWEIPYQGQSVSLAFPNDCNPP